VRTYLKNKRAGSVAHMVESLPRRHEVLGLVLGTGDKNMHAVNMKV
jgi:hypothetical protein